MRRIEMSAEQGDVVAKSHEETCDVTDLLLQDMLTDTLPAGSWLKQIDLEQRYDCTRPEIRRALDRLTQRRLVQHIPNRS